MPRTSRIFLENTTTGKVCDMAKVVRDVEAAIKHNKNVDRKRKCHTKKKS